MRTFFRLVALLATAACSNPLDLGGDDPGAPTASGSATEPPRNEPKAPAVDCSAVPAGVTEIFRSPGDEIFNLTGLASDGVHLYVSGYGRGVGVADGPPPVPNAASPMNTASLLRVPVGGGAREILDYEHVGFTRGVVVDDAFVYWASEAGDAVLARPKAGGPITSLHLPDTGTPQTLTTDGKGSVFWSTWWGGMGSPSRPIASIATWSAATGAPKAFQMGAGKADGALWVTSDADTLYWIAGHDPAELRAAPTKGGSTKVLATGIANAYQLKTDATHVWGVDNDAIWRVSKGGGAVEKVVKAAPGRYLYRFAVTDDALFYADEQSPSETGGPVVKAPVYRANKDGTGATAVSAPLDGTSHMTHDACRIYVATFDWVGSPGYEAVVYAIKR